MSKTIHKQFLKAVGVSLATLAWNAAIGFTGLIALVSVSLSSAQASEQTQTRFDLVQSTNNITGFMFTNMDGSMENYTFTCTRGEDNKVQMTVDVQRNGYREQDHSKQAAAFKVWLIMYTTDKESYGLDNGKSKAEVAKIFDSRDRRLNLTSFSSRALTYNEKDQYVFEFLLNNGETVLSSKLNAKNIRDQAKSADLSLCSDIFNQ